MTRVLLAKLLRDLRWNLLAVMVLLALFQFLWARITERILGKLAPFFVTLAGFGGLTRQAMEQVIFDGPGKILRTIIGGEGVSLDNAMDMLSIGLVHPVMQIVFCIWAIGRASGAIAGEIDRGTMELLLAQPLARSRLLLCHLLVDAVTIPLLCLALWGGCWLGYLAIHPIQVEEPKLSSPLFRPKPVKDDPALRERLDVRPMQMARGLPAVGGLLFAVCGLTMLASAMGRFRWRVLGLAVGVVLVMFMVNVLGQMWDPAAWLRPLTVFYYYQPQELIQGKGSMAALAVLFGTGAAGYALSLWVLTRRDLPAPL